MTAPTFPTENPKVAGLPAGTAWVAAPAAAKLKSGAVPTTTFATAELPSDKFDIRISIRSEIRRWITLWDLHRYYPAYSPEVAVDEVHFDPEAIGDAQIIAEDDESVQ